GEGGGGGGWWGVDWGGRGTVEGKVVRAPPGVGRRAGGGGGVCAVAGADVENRLWGELQRDLHEQLGLRPRDQHAAVDEQLDPPESLASEDVGDRLALDTAADHFRERARGPHGQPQAGLGRGPRPAPPGRA